MHRPEGAQPRKVAAHFTAFVWFLNRNSTTGEDAVPFATDNWPAFLPLAHEGLGRLLLKIASPQGAQARRSKRDQRPRRKAAVASVGGG
jgi:hypothetical protein